MPSKQQSDVDAWLEHETPRIRRALESASRHFDGNDNLAVNTLEAVYGQESSFGTLLGTRGSSKAAGHFQFEPDTARRYGLRVSKENDQRFDIDRAASAAARYLKDLDTMFSKETGLPSGRRTVAVNNVFERKKFAIAAYNAGEGRVAGAQRLAERTGKDSRLWSDVQQFLELAGATKTKVLETVEYVDKVLRYEAEFAIKSPADKRKKQKKPGKQAWCTEGHWRTIDDRPVFICARRA